MLWYRQGLRYIACPYAVDQILAREITPEIAEQQERQRQFLGRQDQRLASQGDRAACRIEAVAVTVAVGRRRPRA